MATTDGITEGMKGVAIASKSDGDKGEGAAKLSVGELEDRVAKANGAYLAYKSIRERGLPYNMDIDVELWKDLVQAEDELARVRFGQRIEDEHERIEAVVDEELERIAGLVKSTDEISIYDLCVVCGEDVTNKLFLAKKHGPEKSGHSMFYCCGRVICDHCKLRATYPDVEKQLGEVKRDGGVLLINGQGNLRCPHCNHTEPCGNDKKMFKAVEKYAKEGVPWAMFDLSRAFSHGKYSTKMNRNKAKKWLLKAAKTKYRPAVYHLGEMYYWAGGRRNNADNRLPLGEWEFSYEKAFECYSSHDGCAGSYLRLSEMHREGHFVDADAEKALRYASLAVYQQEKQLGGKDFFEMFQNCYEYEPKGDEMSLRLFDLSTYWLGRAVEADPKYGSLFAGQLAQYSAEKYWHKHTGGFMFPGYSTLPLAKKLEVKFGVPDAKSSNLIRRWKDDCGHVPCRKTNDGSMKICSGCKVFFYCDRDCQVKHWTDGHKRECKGNHWIKEYLPNL